MLKTLTGRAFRLVQGAQLRVTNTFGSQVIDARAFMADDIDLTAFWASKAIRYQSRANLRATDAPVPSPTAVIRQTLSFPAALLWESAARIKLL
ncbi:hypothetical protein NBRC116589_24010 [Ruegeria sp. HU-ET01832]|uniref:DUF1989 domain-containing protein n=1 Tax=Ruegeria sp. HU-ET01832 TaxID=3135906 RepID=UPI0031021006